MDLVFENFKSFLNSVEKITSNRLVEAKKILQNEGKNIDNIFDIFISANGELFDLLPDGTLIKINLYIATKEIDRYALNSIVPKDLYKYHLYKCSTISTMFNSGRKHRYKINNRKDGSFYYTFHNFNGTILKKVNNQKLNVCKNCLSKFLRKSASDYDVENFNLKNFHKQNNGFFNFDTSRFENGEEARANIYPKEWTKISKQIKDKKNYTCENCNWKAKDRYEKRFLHTHHQNGDKRNNTNDNLTVLCIKCHANVDVYHARIKSQVNYKDFMRIQRNTRPSH